MPRAYVGLGANLGDPRSQIRAAFEALANIPATRLAGQSSFYRSAPLGYAGQPDFINAVAQVQTGLAPRALLDALLAIELALGRKRSHANAPRTLDLDLLLYDQMVIDEPGLRVPHPRMHTRAFVLAPLAEIAPEIEIPGQGPIAPLLAACTGQTIEKLQE
ncbi:MAG: 2-amino-4-hydroxy-6-hydroxymethyldihydropteridine diphosphokinase [Betaproteobacteria bacterium RIFCSPLOWO2_02_FULL_65_20]|nr:MAG: 2-amino-4-hydroxy-6-hydroxymethyldihydropteridine diphosphokinase [Betaproteobacteria bacterium RIFCSPLOWO2_02_FULL_65_20]